MISECVEQPKIVSFARRNQRKNVVCCHGNDMVATPGIEPRLQRKGVAQEEQSMFRPHQIISSRPVGGHSLGSEQIISRLMSSRLEVG